MRRRTFLATTLTSALAVPALARTGLAVPTARAPEPPPETWQEHWFEHSEELRLADHNDTVALYFDRDVDQAASEWLLPYLTSMWQYAQRTYGNSGNRMNEDRLYSIHHEGKHFGGHPSTVYDESHDHRNVSDVGGTDWTTPQYEIVTHETGHIVELIAAGKHGSPAFGLWGDSKWMEFYIYDVYVGLGMEAEAQDFFDRMSADDHVDDFPREGTHWFRDWFHPLWRDHGGAQVMVRYFALLGEHFPASGDSFSRELNWGEFVHFMSGAAGKNLKEQATGAFGWPDDREQQFTKARQEFPGVTY
ncbi:hypothetical protein LCD36_16025 [Saccharopolyspora sp. 6T]|uniref:hypothetical protein n=1 Tax=Saccharopolyspora sp. 6T TaxID=2877238 RepID=UPI001CD1B288|nr:hypothetical protein [Saccharopolyspora sp. 6T]MCA1187941.1 hypothetical protein [Saccharopolyspora sp. 6T]